MEKKRIYRDFLSFWTPIDWMGQCHKKRGNKKYFKTAREILERLKPLEFKSEDCEAFNKAFDIIADAVSDYSRRYLSAIPNKTKSPPVPFEVLEALYVLVYVKCYLRFYANPIPNQIKYKDLKKSVIDGVNTKLKDKWCDSLLRYNVLSASKIGCDPVVDFRNNIIYLHDVGFKYAGKKNGLYGYMLSEVIKYHKTYIGHDTYADIFGGSGQALLYVPLFTKDDKAIIKEYLNDFSKLNVNFYEIVREVKGRSKHGLVTFAEKMVEDMETQSDIGIFQTGENESTTRVNNAYKKYMEACWDYDAKKKSDSIFLVQEIESSFAIRERREEIYRECCELNKTVVYALGLWRYYKKDFFSNYEPSKNEIEGAFAFYFLHYFMFSGKSVTISGVTKERVNEFIKFVKSGEFELLLHLYYCRDLERMRLGNKTDILRGDAIKLLADTRINNENVLCYSDSPYYGTADPYSDKKSDKRDDEFDMKGLMRAFSRYKGWFIFSCRAAAIASNKNDEHKERWLIAELFHWFKDVASRQSKSLFVIFSMKLKTEEKTKKKLCLRTSIEEAIIQNAVFEIMILNFQVQNTRHDNILYVEGDGSQVTEQKTFYVMEFEEFNTVVSKVLLYENEYRSTTKGQARKFRRLFG